MSSADEQILELSDVSFSYGGEPFIRGISFGIGEADLVALIGANGSGKSTVLKLMDGILRPDRGEVRLWRKPLSGYGGRDRAKLVSYLPQTLDASVPFSVEDLAAMGLYPYDTVTGMGLDEALRTVGLHDKRTEPITKLSGGERRRAFIAMGLLQGAGIMLMDEPLANLDIRYQLEIVGLLARLNRERGISVVMAMHDINLAARFRKIVLMKDGMILRIGTPEEVLTVEMLREAFDVEVTVGQNEKGIFIGY